MAGAEASMGSAIMTAGGDAGVDMRSMVVGTTMGDDVVVVARVQVGMIVEMIPSACVAVNARLGITRTEMERAG